MTPKACSISSEEGAVSNMEKSKSMKQKASERFWQNEARTEETKQLIRDIRRNTRRRFTSEEKIRIILEGFRREIPIRDPCRREGIRPNTYYSWLKDFMGAGQERLEHKTARNATMDEVKGIKRENDRLKQLVAELSLEVHVLEKTAVPDLE